MEIAGASTPDPLTLARKARRELIRYFSVAAYLYVCLGALLIYKASILQAHGVEYAGYGVALVKALILGKFILFAEALKFGERIGPGRVALKILWKSLLFALLLVVLSLIEELVVGSIHGRKASEIVMGFAGGTLQQVFALSLLMALIMIPYFAFHEISANMGEGKLVKFLTERRPAGNHEKEVA